MTEFIKTKSFELAVYMKGDLKAKKLILVIPGRLDTKDYAHMRSHVDFLSEKGYLAVSFDPPGTWESPGGIELYTSTNYMKAIDELIGYFGNRPTILLGHSRGGTTAMLDGIKNDHVVGFVAIMSYYGEPADPFEESKLKGWQDEPRDLPPGDKPGGKRRHFKLPLSYFDDGAKYNALDGLRTCKKPKLFIYSPVDEMNDVEDQDVMYEAASEPKEIHTVRSVHDYRLNAPVIQEINDFVWEWLEKNKF